MRKRILAVLGLVLAALMAIAVAGVPSSSRSDIESRLRAFGVPDGAEIGPVQMDGNGDLLMVMYRDSSGQLHTLGGVKPMDTPPPGS